MVEQLCVNKDFKVRFYIYNLFSKFDLNDDYIKITNIPTVEEEK